ncbi:uncharacterized protein LOC135947047 [Cloeon dipterum]|uniref:uncharacterized protein LOC135947047 n=1 Tax=Cloeon dipterum TaxID=197152 RepID=UPI003220314E
MSFHANFPWLKPSAFTEDALSLSQESPTEDRLQCLLNSSISFYLPISYHRSSAFNGNVRDCGKLFAHAAQFILHSEVHEVGFWKAVDSIQAAKQNFPTNSGFLDEQTKLEVFNKRLEECRHVNEYLFEPKILLQLPYFPAVFHQWLCAFTVQWFQLKKKFDFLYLKLHPTSCIPAIVELTKFVHNTERFISCGFSILGLLVKNYPNRSQELIQLIKERFVPKIGHFRDFFEKRDFLDVVCLSLRIFIYTNYGRESLLSVSVKEEYAEDVQIMGIIHTYQGSFLKDGLFNNRATSLIKIERLLMFANDNEQYLKWDDNPMQKVEALYRRRVDRGRRFYFGFLMEHLVETKLLRGLTLPDLQISATVQSVVEKIEDHEHKKSYFTEQSFHMNGHASALCNIMIKEQMQADMIEIVGRIFQFQLVCGKQVEFDISENVCAKFSLPDSICILKEATSKPDLKQSELIDKVRTKFQFDNNKKDSATKNYFDKRAEEFMDRINQLIVAILGEHAKQAGLHFEGQRNLLWIQYILPCFVSSLMSARKIQRFKSDNLNKLVEFINNFIGQFEEDLTTPLAKGSTNYDVHKSGDHIEILDILWQEVKFEVNVYIFDRFTTEASFEAIPGFGELENIFTSFLYHQSYIHQKFVEVNDSWALRQQWFLKRILKSVRTLEICEDPKENARGLLRVHNYFIAVLYRCEKLPRLTYWLLRHVHKKILSLKRKQPLKGIDKNMGELKRKAIAEAENLSLRKTLGIVLYALAEISKNNEVLSLDKDCWDAETRQFLEIYESQDWASLREFLMPIFSGNGRIDLTLFDYNELKNQLITMRMRKRILKGRFVMKFPGEISMLPLKHCRWCGILETPKIKLKMCFWCKEFMDYPNVTWFCSENCEKQCNDTVHVEEHEKFIISCIRF